ncbi:MAG: ATP-binding protein [Candidatus Margulisbacteria bacterium]|nr:ATP-binding protein [Candidatus Margulisiibacteriota bacterium]
MIVRILILDELGYLPFSKNGGQLLFHLLSKIHLKTSVVITTNLTFSEWPQVFGSSRKIYVYRIQVTAEVPNGPMELYVTVIIYLLTCNASQPIMADFRVSPQI